MINLLKLKIISLKTPFFSDRVIIFFKKFMIHEFNRF